MPAGGLTKLGIEHLDIASLACYGPEIAISVDSIMNKSRELDFCDFPDHLFIEVQCRWKPQALEAEAKPSKRLSKFNLALTPTVARSRRRLTS